MEKIRFLATGDFHSDKTLINKIKNKIDFNKIDFILFTGDLSEKKNDFSQLLDIFKDKKIFMVPGNHESKKQLDILKKYYNVHLIGNSPIQFCDDLVVFGSNYLSIGPYGIYEEDILENLHLNFQAIKKTKFKIMMNHIPPIGTKIGDMSPHSIIKSSEAVREFLENKNPDILLCGHIHESSGLEEIVNKTKVINVAKTYKIIEFDKKKKKLKILN